MKTQFDGQFFFFFKANRFFFFEATSGAGSQGSFFQQGTSSPSLSLDGAMSWSCHVNVSTCQNNTQNQPEIVQKPGKQLDLFNLFGWLLDCRLLLLVTNWFCIIFSRVPRHIWSPKLQHRIVHFPWAVVTIFNWITSWGHWLDHAF